MSENQNKDFRPTDGSGPRIVTMAALRNPDREDDEQAYYAGGSEHSGQQVLGPSKRQREDSQSQMGETASSLANAFKNVADMQHSSPGRPKKFTGRGHRLGDGSGNDEPVNQQNSDLIDLTLDDSSDSTFDSPRLDHSAHAVSSDESNGREQEIRVVLYEDGFCIEDEPLRSYMDPSCANLKDYINRGQFPASLIPEHLRSSSVSMCVIDKRPETYKPPQVPAKPFSGKGHLLGSPAPNLTAAEEEAPNKVETDSSLNSSKSEFDFSDGSSKTTVLRVRLPHGELISVTMDLNATILNLRERIIEARPSLGTQTFNILTTFPHRIFDSMDESLLNLGLINSCITLKITNNDA